jgi:aldose sugar dehydrogenase
MYRIAQSSYGGGMQSILYTGLVLIICGYVSACSQQTRQEKGSGHVFSTKDGSVKFHVETMISGLEVPWSIVFTPDNRILITERPGRVRVVENGKLKEQPLYVVSDVESTSEAGLMDLTLHPQFAKNRWLYLSYAYNDKGIKVRVVRFRETGSTLTDRKLIIEDIPAARNHAGCRAKFGPDGKLYITTGDASEKELAQHLNSLAGKTLRLNDDGSVPSDNPFVNQPKVRPEIWSYGHRNAQGIDWHPDTGLQFQTEHGPSGFDGPGGGDEFNLVEKGKNYGWPAIHHADKRAGMETPLIEFTPAVAPASGMFYRGNLFKEFKGNYFFGCLRGTGLMRVVVDGRGVKSYEKLLDGEFGRLRDVSEGPDGAIYVSTSNRDGRGSAVKNDDRILRLVPVK